MERGGRAKSRESETERPLMHWPFFDRASGTAEPLDRIFFKPIRSERQYHDRNLGNQDRRENEAGGGGGARGEMRRGEGGKAKSRPHSAFCPSEAIFYGSLFFPGESNCSRLPLFFHPRAPRARRRRLTEHIKKGTEEQQ